MRHRSALVRAGLATALALGAQLLSGERPVNAAPLRAKQATAPATAHEPPSAAELASGACRLGRWAAAVDLMSVVARQERSAADWLCLARAEFHTGQWVAALDSYDELADSNTPASKEARQLGAVEQRELEQQLGWLEIMPSAPLPASVKLSLDGEPVARSRIGVAFPVQPGPHAFSVEVHGVVREFEHWRIAPSEHRRVNLSLPAEPPAAQQAVAPPRSVERQPTPAPAGHRAAESTELARWARGSLYAGGISAGFGVALLSASRTSRRPSEAVVSTGVGSIVLGGMALFTSGGLYLSHALVGSRAGESAPESPPQPTLQPWVSTNALGLNGRF